MRYLALGDSISIDEYTGVPGGGAASQFARLIGAGEVENRTHDGWTTAGVLDELRQVTQRPDVVTVTAGGNDFLEQLFEQKGSAAGSDPRSMRGLADVPLSNLRRIADRLAEYGCPVILNTVYDPTDGDDSLSTELGIPPEARTDFRALNDGIRALARARGFLLADLEDLFRGHGIRSEEPWFVLQIEPSYAGATAIARCWHALYGAVAR